MSPQLSPRLAHDDDASELARIYNHFVRDSVITFDERELDAAQMRANLDGVRDQGLPWLVVGAPGSLQGYAYATRWRLRSAYRYSVETTIYLDPEACGQGLGRLLYQTLLDQLTHLDLHLAIAGITLPNPASVGLHEALGFTKVAHFAEVGRKFDRWLDVGYWQRRI